VSRVEFGVLSYGDAAKFASLPLAPVDRHVEGVVEMVLDATASCKAAVTRDRLFG
jgi:hypothetical protein